MAAKIRFRRARFKFTMGKGKIFAALGQVISEPEILVACPILIKHY